MRNGMLRAAVVLSLLLFFGSTLAYGQATTELRGSVLDSTGAVIPGAKATLTNPGTGFARTTTSGRDGVYDFNLVPPGTYRLEVEAAGFKKYVRENIELLVTTPGTANVTLQVGAATQVVEVTGQTPLLNTSDASVGQAISQNQVQQLPLFGRDVAGLYSLEPGVVYLGNRTDIDQNMDTRSGAVNGAHSDQSNIMVDGIDSNDQMNGYAFTSVLRMNPDAMEEFRVTTTNYNADEGRSSGAQIAIATKSGTNQFHGSLYEYNRNAATSANDWFIKRGELDSGEPNKPPALVWNNFGGSLGGPIRRDRAFFFLNGDFERFHRHESVVRTIPTVSLKQGNINYLDVNGGTQTLTAAEIQAMDPLGLGPNPAVLSYFQQYPIPNDRSVGDGLNFSGYRFPGAHTIRFDTYIGRLDYNLGASGNHRLFLRLNLQPYDLERGVPFLPSTGPESVNEDYTKGFALGYTSTLAPTVVNNFRWGFTRQSHAVLGSSSLPWIFFRNMDQGITRTHGFTLPIHNFVDDLSWVRGKHSLSFGANLRLMTSPRFSLQNSFSDGITNASWLSTSGIANTGIALDPAANGFPAVDSNFNNSYDFPLIAMMGMVTEDDATYNYNKQGNVLAQGTPIQRHFAVHEYDLYAQDAFRIRPNFTLTYGLRFEHATAPWETTGLQVAPNVNMTQWFLQRGINMNKGVPSNQDPLIQFKLGGPDNNAPGLYPDYHTFAPRLAFAYAPRPQSGWLKSLFGEGDKTSIRAGFGVVNDHFGLGLLNSFDQSGSFGLATTLSNPAGIQTVDCAPRLTSMNVIPATGCSAPGVGGGTIFIPGPAGGFPQTPPTTLDSGGFAIAWGVDNAVKSPYSYMLDFSVTRELSRDFSVEVAYVGHLSHRLLAQEDLAMPENWRDPANGMDYFTAASAISKLGYACASPPCTLSVTSSSVSPQVATFWADLLGPPPAGGYPIVPGSGATTDATQAAYDLFSDPLDGFLANETTGLFVLDLFGYPVAPAPGLNTFFNDQYSSLYAWRSLANANYHSLQVTARKRMAHGVLFDLNYTWSKSIDLMSDAERVGPWGGLGGNIINSWAHKQLRAVSDFDATHQVNSNWIFELPIGRGRAYGHGVSGWKEALIGGWQTSGTYRWTTGFPVNVSNGFTWPTNWQLGGQAMLNGPAPTTKTTKNPATGTVNMFPDASGAFNAFRHPLPGESGNRNVIRGEGYFGWDEGVEKLWHMPYAESHTLQFRWEVFNVPNALRFNVQSQQPELDQFTAFGNYTGLLTRPREMQFALRYQF